MTLETFADRLLVYLSDSNNLTNFLNGMNLGPRLTTLLQNRYNSEFWQVVQVAVGARRGLVFEPSLWSETRLIGREEALSSPSLKTNIDYRIFGQETALWTDLQIDLDTTWQVDQFPGSIQVTPANPANYLGVANLISVLRIDAGNHPLDPSEAAMGATVNAQGQIQTDPPNPVSLTLDPQAGTLLMPDQSIFSLVKLELFPKVGPNAPLLGVPLREDGQPIPDLRMDHQGDFTDLNDNAVPTDPATGLPLDAAGNPIRLARLTIPGGGTVDYRFTFSLPVQTARQTFRFVSRLHLFMRPDIDLINDLRMVLALDHQLAQNHTTLIDLNDPGNRQPNIMALVYESSALNGGTLNEADILRLGRSIGVLIHFFSIP